MADRCRLASREGEHCADHVTGRPANRCTLGAGLTAGAHRHVSIMEALGMCQGASFRGVEAHHRRASGSLSTPGASTGPSGKVPFPTR